MYMSIVNVIGSLSIFVCGLLTFLMYGMINGLHKEIISSANVNMHTMDSIHLYSALPFQQPSQTLSPLQVFPQVVDNVDE